MAPASPRELSERELHEYVADVEGHDSQVIGRRRLLLPDVPRGGARSRRRAPRARHPRNRLRRRDDVRRHAGDAPVQMDVSMTRVARASGKCRLLLCADGYQLPFADRVVRRRCCWSPSSSTRASHGGLLAEARRVLKPGGRVVMVVPNDVHDERRAAAARGSFPIRYPDHLTFTTPAQDARDGCADGFRMREAFALPFRSLPFAANLYHFVVAERA